MRSINVVNYYHYYFESLQEFDGGEEEEEEEEEETGEENTVSSHLKTQIVRMITTPNKAKINVVLPFWVQK